MRRNNREGYKAGNLNSAVGRIGSKYRFIVLADSDSRISPDFVCIALPYFYKDKRLAFVQAPHTANWRHNTNSFPTALGLGVETLWRFLSLKDRYGITPMVGHGTMICVQTLKEVGGFPERVSEDLCLTAILRRRGYHGCLTGEARCYEDLPQTFSQFRRRFEKWLIGAVEFLKHDAMPFALAKRVCFVEKLDLFFNLFSLLNIAVLGVFLFLVNVAWPMISGTWRTATIEVRPLNIIINIPFLSWDIVNASPESLGPRIVVVCAILAPLVYFLPDLWHRRAETIRYISAAFTTFCAMVIPACVTLVTVTLSGRYEFRATGDSSEETRWIRGRSNLSRNLYVGRVLSIAIECSVAVLLVAFAFSTRNLFLLSISLGMLAGPIYTFLDWEDRRLIWFRHLPFALLMVQIVLLTFPAFGYSGWASSLLMIHY